MKMSWKDNVLTARNRMKLNEFAFESDQPKFECDLINAKGPANDLFFSIW